MTPCAPGSLRRALLAALVVVCLTQAPARADEPPGDLVVDGGLVVALPTALPTGASTGAGLGVAVRRGAWLAWGGRAAWTSATEYNRTWTVTQGDLRLRGTAALQHAVGRGVFALRLGLGGTLVHEVRDRNQGQRAGLSGSELQTTASNLVPAGDLELALALRIAGPWQLLVSGGPSLSWQDAGVHAGWTGSLGVAWQP